MAEGGETTTSFDNPAYDRGGDYDDDDDDEGDETAPFLPNGASTPAPGSEEIEMQTIQQEKNGLPEKSYAETSFGVSTSEQAWIRAKDLFPDMSSSELEVSYNTKGRLQVKMFGAGKKLYNLFTTERGTGLEQINKSLPKEIKTALGPSKYERLRQRVSEKRKDLKEKEYSASQKERNKKEMDEIRENLRKEPQNLESLENAEASQKEIDKSKAKITTLESEHQKARKKYDSMTQAEAEEIQVIEEIEAEDLEEEQVIHSIEIIKTIDKQNNALKTRILHDKSISEDAKESEERRKEANERIERNEEIYEKNREEKKMLLEQVGRKGHTLQKELASLKIEERNLDKLIESDKKIAADRNSEPYEVESQKKEFSSTKEKKNG